MTERYSDEHKSPLTLAFIFMAFFIQFLYLLCHVRPRHCDIVTKCVRATVKM